jgi:hypothetical protein
MLGDNDTSGLLRANLRYRFLQLFRKQATPVHYGEHFSAVPRTGSTEPLTNSFQTLLAFCANNTYMDLWRWFTQWRWHHWASYSSSPWDYNSDHWAPWKVFTDNRESPQRTRPWAVWSNAEYTHSIPIVQCPKCGLWLASAWEYSLHVPNEELPFFVHDDDADDSYDDGSICWKIRSLANWIYKEETRWAPSYVPTFLTARLATGLQILCKEREPYYPVVCAVCKVWVQDPGSAKLHKACPAVCWQARHTFWRRPRLSDSCHRNRHALGLTTLYPNLRTLVYWRHAVTQIFQHKFSIVYHSHCLHNLHPVTCLPHIHLVALSYLVSPFGSHVFWTADTVQHKLIALRQILSVVQYLKHF